MWGLKFVDKNLDVKIFFAVVNVHLPKVVAGERRFFATKQKVERCRGVTTTRKVEKWK